MKKISYIITATFVFFAVCSSGKSYGQGAKLTDPEISSVAVTANQIDINYAKIAKEKSKNADILSFASTMISDHQSVIDQAVALVKKLGVTPQDNDVSKKLNAGAETTKKMLLDKPAGSFDKSYIDNEVSYHKAVIETVQNTLIPQSKNPELKALLTKVLPILKTHLSHAEMVQKKFSK
jgi:putative membrane protein